MNTYTDRNGRSRRLSPFADYLTFVQVKHGTGANNKRLGTIDLHTYCELRRKGWSAKNAAAQSRPFQYFYKDFPVLEEMDTPYGVGEYHAKCWNDLNTITMVPVLRKDHKGFDLHLSDGCIRENVPWNFDKWEGVEIEIGFYWDDTWAGHDDDGEGTWEEDTYALERFYPSDVDNDPFLYHNGRDLTEYGWGTPPNEVYIPWWHNYDGTWKKERDAIQRYSGMSKAVAHDRLRELVKLDMDRAQERHRGERQEVGIEVIVKLHGEVIAETCVWGFDNDDRYKTESANNLISEALNDAREALTNDDSDNATIENELEFAYA